MAKTKNSARSEGEAKDFLQGRRPAGDKMVHKQKALFKTRKDNTYLQYMKIYHANVNDLIYKYRKLEDILHDNKP